MENARFRVNTPDVMHETIDGEVIVINLTSGNYYSVRGAGTDVWELVQAAPSVSAAEVVHALAARFDGERSEIDVQISRFLDELRDEGLLASVERAGGHAAVVVDGADVEKRAFEAPRLEKYTDMQDLVLLDPVHQVDEAGWPQAKPDVSVTGANA